MSNRWKVVRWEVPFPEPHHRWEVIEDLGTVEEFHGPFTTHTDAMTYADRMARTTPKKSPTKMNITIPTNSPKKRGDLMGESDPNGNGYNLRRVHKGKQAHMYLEPGDLIPVALTLLALARKEKA